MKKSKDDKLEFYGVFNRLQLLVNTFPRLNGSFATDNFVTMTPNERSADK